jgi:5,10-methylenetetrahydrofolate reductase
MVGAAVVASPEPAIEDAGVVEPECPKHMVYGPCGGVRADGGCEVGDRPCPFVERPVVAWTGPVGEVAGFPLAPRRDGGPVIVTDMRVRPFDRRSALDIAARLAPNADAVLIGEHHNHPDFPPSMMAWLVQEAGGTPWVTLTCRDRNRVLLESELAALADVGVAGVHCVTGDSRAASVRADATQVFDLDSTRLAALAAHLGLRPSVAATPVAPPVEQRGARLLEKQRAGAVACFVNHAGGAAGVERFVAGARAIGVGIPFIPCVAVVTDAESVATLERFPGLVIDAEVRATVLAAGDGRSAGIRAAVEEARRMLAIDGVVGVNLSGSATAGPEIESAAIMDEVAVRIRALASARSPRR